MVIVDKYEGDLLNANSRLFNLVRDIDIRIEHVLLETAYDKSGFINTFLNKESLFFLQKNNSFTIRGLHVFKGSFRRNYWN